MASRGRGGNLVGIASGERSRGQQRAQRLRLCRKLRFDGVPPPIRRSSRYSTPRLRKDSSLPGEEFARNEM
jgi:hypothetical protein